VPKIITQEYLKSILYYDPLTGDFVWTRSSKNNQHEAGTIAGYTPTYGGSEGYVMIGIDGEHYRAHRLAFLYITGTIPAHVDHEDRNRSNNKWDNLRCADKQSNAANVGIRSDNTSGYKGVSYRSDKNRTKKWRAHIYKNGKQIVLGTYHTKIEAAKAHDEAAIILFGEFAVTNKILGLI